MRFRWIALGIVGFAVWLIATFGVVYAAVELAEDDRTEAFVTERYVVTVPSAVADSPITRYCVSYTIQGVVGGKLCEGAGDGPSDCYLDAEVGKRLPSSCQLSD